ncbi:MAG TPA: hypothetical protein VF015_07315, partial [Acidimicrobiales bacterium]
MSDQAPSATSGAMPGPPAEPSPDTPHGATVGDAVRWLVAAACVGAAVIHFAYAPPHLDEAASHGAFFLAVAWAQLGAAVALARWRDARWPWWAAAGLNAAVIGVWVVSRTIGVPGSDAESVGFADVLATGLEAVAVAGALVALRPAVARRPVVRLHPAVGG